jgi:hypothetical protein
MEKKGKCLIEISERMYTSTHGNMASHKLQHSCQCLQNATQRVLESCPLYSCPHQTGTGGIPAPMLACKRDDVNYWNWPRWRGLRHCEFICNYLINDFRFHTSQAVPVVDPAVTCQLCMTLATCLVSPTSSFGQQCLQVLKSV